MAPSTRKLQLRPSGLIPLPFQMKKSFPLALAGAINTLSKSCYAIWGHEEYSHSFYKSMSKNQQQPSLSLFLHPDRSDSNIVKWIILQHLKWHKMPKSCKGTSSLSQQIHFPVYKNCIHVCKQQYNLWLKPQKGKKYLLEKIRLLWRITLLLFLKKQ